MFRFFGAPLLALATAFLGTTYTGADAGERTRLGHGRLMTNDYIGDGNDRWRTGSWTSSRVWGPAWEGQLPDRFGALVELRLSAEIIAPQDINTPAVGDRPYAGQLSAGVHTHFRWQGMEAALGGDLVAAGSATGLGTFQRETHELLGIRVPSDETLDAQISDIRPSVVGELGRELALGQNMRLRPFVEGRAGAETMVRAGFDVTLGQMGQAELWVRESVTGHRYRVIQNNEYKGFALVAGADIAHVTDSYLLPEEDGFDLVESRERARLGVHWQGDSASAFYGVTYLGEEFEAQREGQVVGSIRINLSF
ncbi:lipid A deacylase LpxR family protein [Sulfitobacter sp. S190]|uniref:lipid A deacylase LpxR family protein n=1 Tax=Sulfitobacter sp. S190 TaxID=2867022 RepID=UPI0021A64896|nr:lipid A deacylase LpxR family protein [Sulfitobacter sp. S190]UWR21717.1 lipid A deacylase LpxR family protein [Sulfitobacter sp. S190]